MFIGVLIQSSAYLGLAYCEHPSIESLSSLLFIATLGQLMVDVMADTLVVEFGKKVEDDATRGQMQASCYSVRFFGAMLGSASGSLLYNRDTWGWGLTFSQVCTLLGLLPVFSLLPFLPMLYERKVKKTPTYGQSPFSGKYKFDQSPFAARWGGNTSGLSRVSKQCKDIWDTVQLREVWRPMIFVYVYGN
jgi:MFS family permease